MRADALDHPGLLELDAEAGTIRFAGQRALLIDTVAMGLLRRYLVDNFGLTAARTVFTQFGFASGWRLAEAVREQLELGSDDEWRAAGMRIHALHGLFRVEPGAVESLTRAGTKILGSYEAEQHVLHFGRSDVSVCWTICGLTSGYASRTSGTHVYVFEDRCVGKGDAVCHLFGRKRSELGDDRADDLRFFEPQRLKECLDVSLQRVIDSLNASERKLEERKRALVRVAPEEAEPLGIVARSPRMRQVVDLAKRVAQVDSTVLVTGESGAGKERIARLVHDGSPRAPGPFIAVNCGAISEELLESELFGHARGSFTGAVQDRAGLFEAANRGTLLLDEVGDVSIGMQVKLLRVLQEREIRRVGESKSRRVDVRIVAATNRDLALAVENGSFRRDLYYRLKVVELHVPALRERREDILTLAHVLLADAALQMKRKIAGLAPSVADLLMRYAWPGNVRELGNAMERAVALSRGNRVEIEDLPEELRSTSLPGPSIQQVVRPLEEIEQEYILAALEHNRGNQTHTAQQLRIGSATLYRKLKKYSAAAKPKRATH